jgi:hypothetical protein
MRRRKGTSEGSALRSSAQTVVVDSAAEEDGDIVRVFSIERDSQKGLEAEK